jgi:hypothetical protein
MSLKLGLDVSKYNKIEKNEDLFGDEDWGFTPRCMMDDAERFKECEKLKVTCSACRREVDFSGLLSDITGGILVLCVIFLDILILSHASLAGFVCLCTK